MFGIKFKKQKEKKKEKIKIKIKYKIKNKEVKKTKKNLAVLKTSIQKAKPPANQTQTQNQTERYRDKEFIKYRTKTLAKTIEDTTKTNLIAVFKEKIYNINYLSVGDDEYAVQNDLTILNKIIDFIEKKDYLLDPKYTEDVWHIMAELYHLKSMITNQHIYTSTEIEEEINEIIAYTSEHL